MNHAERCHTKHQTERYAIDHAFSNLIIGSYYQEATMTITLGQKEKLYLLMKDAGYITE